jgi:hypothetical protein
MEMRGAEEGSGKRARTGDGKGYRGRPGESTEKGTEKGTERGTERGPGKGTSSRNYLDHSQRRGGRKGGRRGGRPITQVPLPVLPTLFVSILTHLV